jgi:hypothetical protein
MIPVASGTHDCITSYSDFRLRPLGLRLASVGVVISDSLRDGRCDSSGVYETMQRIRNTKTCNVRKLAG